MRFHVHRFGKWERIQELPLWHRTFPTDNWAIGTQPQELRRYINNTTKNEFSQWTNDENFRLVGKVVEQRRKCAVCDYTEVNMQQWRVE